MGPRNKKDRNSATTNNGSQKETVSKSHDRQEQLQADHELFLQAFEKPTQIYRYLRTRNMISPIFLHRTLSFMRKRTSRSRSDKYRQDFKVDSLLKRKESEIRETDTLKLDKFMNLTFLGYYDRKYEKTFERVSVELILVKLTHKKRKEATSPYVQIPLGSTEIQVNPSEDHPPSKAPALSIPSESFNLANGHHIKTCSLLVRVHHTPLSQLSNGTTKHHDLKGEGDCNPNHNDASSENGDHENLEPTTKRRKMNRDSGPPKLLSAELIVYDKHAQCLLTEGEYELILAEVDPERIKMEQKLKNSTWENITIDKTDMAVYQQFNVFGNSPTLKFRLHWSPEQAMGMVERPRPLMPRDNCHAHQNGGGSDNSLNHGIGSSNNHRRDRSRLSRQSSSVTSSNHTTSHRSIHTEKPPRIVYQFLYNNNSRQQTEAREDLHCPWCSLNCMELYSLLKHLKLSHPRFLFSYVPIQDGARIDVSVSELYDSTYVGNPQDMISQPPGYAFSRGGPVQRNSITHVLVCKPKRPVQSLTEFLEIEENDLNGPYDDNGSQRPFVSGHNRLYHYSNTNLPQPPFAINQPAAEDMVDQPWLITRICRMIDEFSDVNEGEKEFIKMWNIHVQHFTFVGDCQMNLALKMFIDEKGKELLEKNLYRNFVLHVCNLFEFGVLGPGHVFTAITRMQKFLSERNHVFTDWPQQLSHWSAQAHEHKSTSAHSNQFAGDIFEKCIAAKMERDKRGRKDFSGIFKNSDKIGKINPFVVLSPLNMKNSGNGNVVINSDDEDEEDDETMEAATATKVDSKTRENTTSNSNLPNTTVKQEEES